MGTVQEHAHQPKSYLGVMVSSTFSDIPDHRAEAVRIIEERQLFACVMERDSAKPGTDVIQSSLQMVRDSAAYMGVVTHKYGQNPNCPDRNPNGLSLTELEFNEAQRLGLPTLLFIMGERHKGERSDFEQDPEKLAKLEAFRRRAKRALPGGVVERVYATFQSLDEFKDLAANAIADLATYISNAHSLGNPQHNTSSNIVSIDQQEPRPNLFGRERELSAVVAAVLQAQPVVIAGGPGFGKTALAISALYDEKIVQKFGRRRILIPFDAAEDARSLLSQLVGATGMTSTRDEASLLRQLQTSAEKAPLAVVLDNVEGIFDAQRGEAERILRLIAQIPGLHTITTIRGAPPLVAGAKTIEDLSRLDVAFAREAFLAVGGERLRQDPDLELLIEALDGHVLSIQLLAAQAIGLPSLHRLREAWEDEHALILRRFGEGENRLTSVRASLSLSLKSRLLTSSPLAKRLLAMLSYLPVGLAEDNVRVLLGERGRVTRTKAFEAITVLHKLRLIEPRLDSRLRMLTPLRESILTDYSLIGSDRKRLFDFYIDVALQGGAAIGTSKWEETSSRILSESGNIDYVLNMVAKKDINNWRLVAALTGLCDIGYIYGQIGHSAIEFCAKNLASSRTEDLAICSFLMGKTNLGMDHVDGARRYFNDAKILGMAANNPMVEANGIFGLAQVSLRLSDHAEAKKNAERARDRYKQINARLGLPNSISLLGDIEFRREDYGCARRYWEEALSLYQEADELLGQANAVSNLATLDWTNAREGLEFAQDLYERLGVRSSLAYTLGELGDFYLRQGSLDRAERFYLRARDVAQTSGEIPSEAHSLARLGQLRIRKGQSGQADAAAGFALWLTSLHANDPTRTGWEKLHAATSACDDQAEQRLRAEARSSWRELGRYDLVRDWIDFPN